MTELSAAAGTAAAMLRFLIFTACRTNEVVDARWNEIDRALSAWRIPGERMKMNQDHVVPLAALRRSQGAAFHDDETEGPLRSTRLVRTPHAES